MEASDADHAQPLVQRREDGALGQVVDNFKQLRKSLDIMKSSLTIFTSNVKLMLLMIFSIVPFYVFMVVFEIKLRKAIVAAPDILSYPYSLSAAIPVDDIDYADYAGPVARTTASDVEYGNTKEKFLFDILELCVLYLVVYPLLEVLSMSTTIQIAAKVYAGEKISTFKEVFYRKNNVKGVLISCGCVQFLSAVTLLGLIWVFVHHWIFDINFEMLFTSRPLNKGYFLNILSIGVHTIFFVTLLYKYLRWSSAWNMTMVISVLEEETGVYAFGKADYYGKHHKPTGFQLMLGFVVLNIVLRLPCLYVFGGSSNSSAVEVTSAVIAFVCLGNLVKWVAFVLYYFDCKQQTMEKKDDAEIGNLA